MNTPRDLRRDATRESFARFLCVCVCLLCAATLRADDDATPRPNFDLKALPWNVLQTIPTPQGEFVLKRAIVPNAPKALEPITLTIGVEKPSRATVLPNDLEGKFGDFQFDYLGEDVVKLDGDRELRARRWRLFPLKESGELKIPVVPLRVEIQTSDGEPLELFIPETTIAFPTDLRNDFDVKPDLSPIARRSPLPFLALLLASLMLLALALLRRRKRIAVERSDEIEEKISPRDKALQALERLKTSREYLENAPEVYDEIDAILRRYLDEEFQIAAQERTSQEIIRAVERVPGVEFDDVVEDSVDRDPRESPHFRRFAADALRQSGALEPLRRALDALDLVKFAKRATTFQDASALRDDSSNVVTLGSESLELSLDKLKRRIDKLRADRQAELSRQDADSSEPDPRDVAPRHN